MLTPFFFTLIAVAPEILHNSRNVPNLSREGVSAISWTWCYPRLWSNEICFSWRIAGRETYKDDSTWNDQYWHAEVNIRRVLLPLKNFPPLAPDGLAVDYQSICHFAIGPFPLSVVLSLIFLFSVYFSQSLLTVTVWYLHTWHLIRSLLKYLFE